METVKQSKTEDGSQIIESDQLLSSGCINQSHPAQHSNCHTDLFYVIVDLSQHQSTTSSIIKQMQLDTGVSASIVSSDDQKKLTLLRTSSADSHQNFTIMKWWTLSTGASLHPLSTLHLSIHGITCKSCIMAIRQCLSAVPSAVIVNINVDGEACIAYDPTTTTTSSILQAIEDCGFEPSIIHASSIYRAGEPTALI
jgi:copper chaperone CopZ